MDAGAHGGGQGMVGDEERGRALWTDLRLPHCPCSPRQHHLLQARAGKCACFSSTFSDIAISDAVLFYPIGFMRQFACRPGNSAALEAPSGFLQHLIVIKAAQPELHLLEANSASQITCLNAMLWQVVTFRLPMNVRSPIVLVAAGTGYAPLRGFLQHRTKLLQAGTTLGPCVLVFGCRALPDFICRCCPARRTCPGCWGSAFVCDI